MALPFVPVFDVRQRKKKRRVLLEQLTRYEIRKHCGVHEEFVDQLFDILEPFVEPTTRRNRAVPAETKVLLCLSFFRSGSFQYVEGSTAGVSQSVVSRTIDQMTNSIVTELMPHYIRFSTHVPDINVSKSRFNDIAGFPNIVGLIDGTHVTIKSPNQNEPSYVNRKNSHSINCQVVCDWDNSFKNVVAKYPGCTHDAFIWRMSNLKQKFQNGDFGNSWLLGDSGYGCEPWLLTPYGNPVTAAERRYNRSLTRTRSLVERSIGIWKSRWRSMDLSGGRLCYDETKVCKIIVSTAVLHNFCIQRRIPLLEEDEFDEEEGLRRALHNDMMDEPEREAGIHVRNNVVQNYFQNQ